MASDMLILELNTLAVVQFLLCCLQSEVSRAESSLLQAAASYPLYGRAHCITAVLQHLNTEAPPRDSCPHGHFSSETSAGLQRILQEIQPRSTNDATGARQLDTHHRDDQTQSQTAHTPSLDTGES
ncbi:thyroid adenoma-associated protein homolog [Lates japonicus]|uniref:Thyroid adenoma-associated protein homolog n=1 Tax=Lates japonicus TaxID=270547 RepID=A0AAD3MY94_LATJO|nr:thyroid adenoma-associated protein homolog [Lates japonicus]